MAAAGKSAWFGALFMAYPLMAYLALRLGAPPRYLALALLGLAGARWGRFLSRKVPVPLLVAGAAAAGALAWFHGSAPVLYYPAAVNLALLTAFAASLRFPPSAIERIARLREPDLDERGVRYTRRVTLIWCVFFAANGAVAAATAAAGDHAIWAFYNGFLAYVLMGALFLGEWLVRRRVRTGGRG